MEYKNTKKGEKMKIVESDRLWAENNRELIKETAKNWYVSKYVDDVVYVSKHLISLKVIRVYHNKIVTSSKKEYLNISKKIANKLGIEKIVLDK